MTGDPTETLLFVYGTLRRGGPNHALLAAARFVDAATTADRYALFVDGIPFLAPVPAVHRVRGEVYAVDAAMLAEIDRLEGHPTWYERRPVAVVLDGAAHVGDEVAHLRAARVVDHARRHRRQILASDENFIYDLGHVTRA